MAYAVRKDHCFYSGMRYHCDSKRLGKYHTLNEAKAAAMAHAKRQADREAFPRMFTFGRVVRVWTGKSHRSNTYGSHENEYYDFVISDI